MISIFLKGLHPVFQPLQVHFSIPGNLPAKFDELVAIIRKFAATPTMAVELAKLKSGGLSQHMFSVGTPSPESTSSSASQTPCFHFAKKGACRFGTSCRFLHVPTPKSVQPAKPQVSLSQKPQSGAPFASAKATLPLNAASESISWLQSPNHLNNH